MRRAVELAGDLAVPGLSPECCAYIASHPSNVYDGPALRMFARGLLADGQRDRAAAVYCGLLRVRFLLVQGVLCPLHVLTTLVCVYVCDSKRTCTWLRSAEEKGCAVQGRWSGSVEA